MKETFYIICLSLFLLQCKSKNLSINEIKNIAFIEAKEFAEAMVEHDFEKLYKYNTFRNEKKMTESEFVNSCELSIKDFETTEKMKKRVVEKPLNFVQCKNEYQCVFNQTSFFENVNGEIRTAKTKLIGYSKNGEDWTFEVTNFDIKYDKKYLPYICEGLLN